MTKFKFPSDFPPSHTSYDLSGRVQFNPDPLWDGALDSDREWGEESDYVTNAEV